MRLIGADGQQVGVIALAEALQRARREKKDLVEISPDARPPVCKILDYGEFKYKKSKRQRKTRARQKQADMKEIKFRIATGEGDYQVKLRNAVRFLSAGSRVKALVAFRGREIAKKELGEQRLHRLREDLVEYADVERGPVLEGARLHMFFTPKTKRKQHAENENQ